MKNQKFIAWDGTGTSKLKDATGLVHRLYEEHATLKAVMLKDPTEEVLRLKARVAALEGTFRHVHQSGEGAKVEAEVLHALGYDEITP